MDPKQILVDHGNRISAPFAQLPAELLSSKTAYRKSIKKARSPKLLYNNDLCLLWGA
jgi:hypothetical protein